MTQCTATQLIDDSQIRVTRFDFEPGQETGWHVHELEFVITTLTDCQMKLEHPDGTTSETTIPAGSAYRRACGVEHNVINAGDAPMAFIEVELKSV